MHFSQRILFVAAAIALACATTASAKVPSKAKADKPVKLEAEGGVTAQVPDWKRTRTDKAVAVLEYVAPKGGSFALLVLAAEAGPADDEDIDWQRIRTNITTAADKGDARLTLTDKGDHTGTEGFKGKHFEGTLQAKEHKMSVEMIALVGDGKLVTVTILTPEKDKGAADLATDVAKSVAAATP